MVYTSVNDSLVSTNNESFAAEPGNINTLLAASILPGVNDTSPARIHKEKNSLQTSHHTAPDPPITIRRSNILAKPLLWHTDYVLSRKKSTTGNYLYSIVEVLDSEVFLLPVGVLLPICPKKRNLVLIMKR